MHLSPCVNVLKPLCGSRDIFSILEIAFALLYYNYSMFWQRLTSLMSWKTNPNRGIFISIYSLYSYFHLKFVAYFQVAPFNASTALLWQLSDTLPVCLCACVCWCRCWLQFVADPRSGVTTQSRVRLSMARLSSTLDAGLTSVHACMCMCVKWACKVHTHTYTRTPAVAHESE